MMQTMKRALRASDRDLAIDLYAAIDDEAARAWLDYLIDHPGETFDSEALQAALGFAEHKQVALSAYAIGEIAASLGLMRPWEEGQRGYTLPDAQAGVLREAREAASR